MRYIESCESFEPLWPGASGPARSLSDAATLPQGGAGLIGAHRSSRIHICLYIGMSENLEPAAELFKALSSASRLKLLRILAQGSSTVGHLAEQSGLSQPLVSQHLRTLRSARLVSVQRTGREAHYEVADSHVTHIVDDAAKHALEG